LTANAGANLKELMVRMEHDSERAALVYLHSTGARQRTLAGYNMVTGLGTPDAWNLVRDLAPLTGRAR